MSWRGKGEKMRDTEECYKLACLSSSVMLQLAGWEHTWETSHPLLLWLEHHCQEMPPVLGAEPSAPIQLHSLTPFISPPSPLRLCRTPGQLTGTLEQERVHCSHRLYHILARGDMSFASVQQQGSCSWQFSFALPLEEDPWKSPSQGQCTHHSAVPCLGHSSGQGQLLAAAHPGLQRTSPGWKARCPRSPGCHHSYATGCRSLPGWCSSPAEKHTESGRREIDPIYKAGEKGQLEFLRAAASRKCVKGRGIWRSATSHNEGGQSHIPL